jgi:hypothetical protein
VMVAVLATVAAFVVIVKISGKRGGEAAGQGDVVGAGSTVDSSPPPAGASSVGGAATPGSDVPVEPRPATAGSNGSASVGSAGSDGVQLATTDPPHDPPPDAPPDAPREAAANNATKPASCRVTIVSTPAGAQIGLENNEVLGTTPGTFDLPCDVETKLYFRKAKYFGVIKPVVANADGVALDIKLQKAVFSLKVTSTPAGATISIGGKPSGLTPSTIKVTAFEATTITIAKDGFAPDSQKVTPKQNNASHHVTLKKNGRAR